MLNFFSFVLSVTAGVVANGISSLIKRYIGKKTQQKNKPDTE